jgi:hypothetical protein
MNKRIVDISISVAISLLTVFVSYHIFFLSKSIKEFQINIDNITYTEKYKSNNDSFTFVTLTIKNIGNQPILKSDFSSELTFNADSLEIVDLKIIKVVPNNLHIQFNKYYKNQIFLNSTLLNKDDEVTFDLIIKGKIKNLFVDARIAGIDNIKQNISDNLNNMINFQFKDLEANKSLKILTAGYGYSNCMINITERLNKQIQNNKILLDANTDLYSKTDPCPGKVKFVFAKYRYCGFVDSVYVTEGNTLIIPRFNNMTKITN